MFAILTAIEIVSFIIGLILYFLITKRCGVCSGMTGPNDVCVSITLNLNTAMGALILVVLSLASVNENGSIMAASTGVCIEQGILLIVSLTSIKA